MSPEKGGALRTECNAGRRAAIALVFAAALGGVPLLLSSGPAQADHAAGSSLSVYSARPANGAVIASARALGPRAVLAAARLAAAPDPAPAPPAPAATLVTAPAAAAAPAPTPPTTAPPAPPAPAPATGRSARGLATWYPTSPRPTGCASPTLPFGTAVAVVDAATGAGTTCVVDDREPFHPGRVLDLSYTVFVRLASPAQGVVTVTITW